MSGAVTIPGDMHARMIETCRKEYEDEFGCMDEQRTYTRDALVDKYADDILFWKKRVPEIDTSKRPSTRQICAHAISTNALTNMWSLCREKKIETEVQQRLKER